MGLKAARVLVIGGGIGGLAAAIACAARGARVTLCEQAGAITELGAGLQISPNGGRVLAALGIALDGSVQAQAVSLRDHSRGREVVRLDLARLAAGQDYRFVHRADLISALLGAAQDRGVEMRLGERATHVVTGRPARVTFASGAVLESDLVIGADGVKSVTRGVLNGVTEARFTGQVAWRAVVANACGHPSEARVHMGPGRHLVSYPLRGGDAVNLVAVEERACWTAEGWQHEDDPANLRAAFSQFGGDVPGLLADVTSPGLWGLFRHPVARHWFGEGVALLGDGAHPTLPFLAQGANLALEDAWVLADCLERQGIEEGLARYEALRVPRAERVIAAAEGNAWKYHLRNPLLRGAAHLALGIAGQVAPGAMVRQFDWLYGLDVTRPM